MNASTLIRRAAGVFVLAALFVASVIAQNLNNTGTWVNNGTASYNNITNSGSGTITNNGTLRVRGRVTNTAAQTAFDTRTGTMDYRGLNVSQDISPDSVHSNQFGNLIASRGGTKTLLGNAVVATQVTTNNLTGTGTVLAVGTRTLTLNGTGTVVNIVSGTVTFAATGTADYAGGAANVAALNYGHLTFSNAAGTRTFQSGTTGIAGNFTTGGLGADARTNSSTIDYNGGGAQSIGQIDYANLTLSNAGTKSFATGTTRINANFTISGSAVADARSNTTTVEFDGGAQNIASVDYNTLTLNGAGTKTFFGTTRVNAAFNITAGTPDLTTNSTTFEYDGSGTQTVRSGFNYFNLLTSNTGTKTAAGNITVNNNLDNGGGSNNATTFDMGSSTLAVTGTTDNTGATIQFGGLNNGVAISTGTIEYNGTGVQNVTAGSYAALSFTGGLANAKTIGGATTATALVLVNSGSTLSITNQLDATLASGTGFNNAGSLDVSGTLNITADMVNSGSVTNTGTIQVGTD